MSPSESAGQNVLSAKNDGPRPIIRRVRAYVLGIAPALSRPTARPILRIIALAISVRLTAAMLAFLANLMFPAAGSEPYTVYRRANAFWDAFARHDSGWYIGIARQGYRFMPQGRHNMAFFPIYPLAMRRVARELGGSRPDFAYAGILISWTSFVLAMIMLYRLARMDIDEDAAERSVLYAAVFPFAFFYGVIYSESLFLLLIVTAFYCFRTRQPILGGASAALATATRVNGVMALPALAWLVYRGMRSLPKERVRWLLGLALAPCGILAYSLYVLGVTGSPFEWYASITRWEYHPGGPPWILFGKLIFNLATRPYSYLCEASAPIDTLNGLTALGVIICLPFVWKKLGTAYGLFILANLWLPLSSGIYEGLGRYCLVLFPFFIWLGVFRSRLLKSVLLVVFAMTFTLCAALYATLRAML
jgi:hypothetical protein